MLLSILLDLVFEAVKLLLPNIDAHGHIPQRLHLKELLFMLRLVKLIALNIALNFCLYAVFIYLINLEKSSIVIYFLINTLF